MGILSILWAFYSGFQIFSQQEIIILILTGKLKLQKHFIVLPNCTKIIWYLPNCTSFDLFLSRERVILILLLFILSYEAVPYQSNPVH